MRSRTKEEQIDGYPHLANLAAFIIGEKLDFFVKEHFAKCVAYDVISADGLSSKEVVKQDFHRSCKKLLTAFTVGRGKQMIERWIECMFEHSLGPRDENQLIIDDIVMISTIRAESLRTCIKEYTRDVEEALSIVTELDRFNATLNTIVFERHSKTLMSNLKMNNDALRMSNEKLREFAYVVSHDLKAPLRKTSTYLDLIREKITVGDADAIYSYLDKTQSAARQMQDLIDKLLTFASVDNQDPEKERCDLNIIIQEVIENLGPAIKQKGATITADNLPAVLAARFQMTQLFQNLLSNALKFCKEDLPPVIEISHETITRPDKSYLVILVKDNCIGFKSEHSAIVFSAFTRLHRQYDGTGLGLSICKKIVENHGGSISVRSDEGVGSEFRIELPLS